MGGKSTPKAKQSANEKALADISMQKWNRYKNTHQGTEKAFINEVSRDSSALLRGRAVADVAQAAGTSANDAVVLGRGTSAGLGATAEGIGSARIGATVGANKVADNIQTSGRLNAVKIGNDMSADAQAGLSAAARASNTTALGKARAQQMVNEAKQSAFGQLAGAGIQGYQLGKERKAVDKRHGEVLASNKTLVDEMKAGRLGG